MDMNHTLGNIICKGTLQGTIKFHMSNIWIIRTCTRTILPR